jgi:hypothetical protein
VTLHDLQKAWTTRASELEPYSPAAAEAFRRAAAELRGVLADDSDSVSLSEAHEIGGYSVDHLSRLLRDRTIENVGKKGGRPRIRRADVPMKPGHANLRSEPAAAHISASAVVATAIHRSNQ